MSPRPTRSQIEEIYFRVRGEGGEEEKWILFCFIFSLSVEGFVILRRQTEQTSRWRLFKTQRKVKMEKELPSFVFFLLTKPCCFIRAGFAAEVFFCWRRFFLSLSSSSPLKKDSLVTSPTPKLMINIEWLVPKEVAAASPAANPNFRPSKSIRFLIGLIFLLVSRATSFNCAK